MDRTVDAALLRNLLAESAVLPTADVLTRLMIQAELNGLMTEGQQAVEPDLLESVGWFLLGAAASPAADEYYGTGLRRQAFQVAAHLLDLTLRTAPDAIDPLVRARLCFASQVAYLRGSQHPNAAALFRKAYPEGHEWPGLLANAPLATLHLGMQMLAGRMRTVQRDANVGVRDIRALEQRWGMTSLSATWLGATSCVILGVRRLVRFQQDGQQDALSDAQRLFREAVESARGDSLSKWVASHLLDLSEDLERSSPWTVLPPDVPARVIRAFTHDDSPVITLWPPQVEFLGGQEGRVFRAEARRLFLASPTSAGKTLIAQLLVAVHLGRGGKGACFVVPTRSLSAEVSQGLRRRLGTLGAVVQQSDVLTPDLPLDEARTGQKPLISVVTPEKLSYLLHRDAQAVLDAFDLFVFDEVHNVNNENRGWLLESLITYLHTATVSSGHKLMLMSAAIGNANHFLDWMGTDEQPYSNVEAVHAAWRAPRRLTVIYRTVRGARQETVSIRRSTDERTFFALDGTLTSPLFSLVGQSLVIKNVGRLAIRHAVGHGTGGNVDQNASTRQYLTAVPLVESLLRFGLVLAVIQQKSLVQAFALELAERLPSGPVHERLTALMEETRRTLGDEHPLVTVLAKGVAFHHADVPTDLRLKIEREASAGTIHCIVCTTSLTEGVNLPVHSVVIVQRHRRDSSGRAVAALTPSQMLNALGRAGRAAMETEGLLVLVADPGERSDQRILQESQPSAQDLQIVSTLADAATLQAFTRLEAQLAQDESTLFTTTEVRGDSFITFVWWLAALHEDQAGHALEVVSQTFAARQLPPESFNVVMNLTRQILRIYNATDPVARRRWARTSTSVGTSFQLDQLAEQVSGDIHLFLSDGTEFVERLLDLVLDQLLHLKEVRRSLGSTRVTWPHRLWLHIWLTGGTVQDMRAVSADLDINATAVQSYLYDFFEFTLPWVLSSLLERMATQPGEAPVTVEDIPALTALVRFGLPQVVMVPSVRDGLLSRSLAVRVWRAAGEEMTDQEDVKTWLGHHTPEQWVEQLVLTTYELESLLRFVSVGVDIQSVGTMRIAKIDVPGFQPELPFEVVHTELRGVPLVSLTQAGQALPLPVGLHLTVSNLLNAGYDLVVGDGLGAGLMLILEPEIDN